MTEFIKYLKSEGITYFDWNVASGDAASQNVDVDTLVNNVLNDVGLYHTSVVLMHDTTEKTTSVEALGKIIESIQALGIEMRPLDENVPPVQHIKAESVNNQNGGLQRSFFKEFKEDLSQAVNELLPEEELLSSDTEIKNDDELLEDSDDSIDLDDFDNLLKAVSSTSEDEVKPEEENAVEEASVIEENVIEEESPELETVFAVEEPKAVSENNELSDESAVITRGTTIKGDIESTGSLEIVGTVTGNVSCSGKLTITGKVTGNSKASEIFADSAKIEGEVVSEGTVKVGVGSVIIGNVTATSAVIAGAINGNIDVNGPVIVDSSAVIMGDIKSRSVQINNGAVIEGFCSQSYSDVNVKAFFEEKNQTTI